MFSFSLIYRLIRAATEEKNLINFKKLKQESFSYRIFPASSSRCVIDEKGTLKLSSNFMSLIDRQCSDRSSPASSLCSLVTQASEIELDEDRQSSLSFDRFFLLILRCSIASNNIDSPPLPCSNQKLSFSIMSPRIFLLFLLFFTFRLSFRVQLEY